MRMHPPAGGVGFVVAAVNGVAFHFRGRLEYALVDPSGTRVPVFQFILPDMVGGVFDVLYGLAFLLVVLAVGLLVGSRADLGTAYGGFLASTLVGVGAGTLVGYLAGLAIASLLFGYPLFGVFRPAPLLELVGFVTYETVEVSVVLVAGGALAGLRSLDPPSAGDERPS